MNKEQEMLDCIFELEEQNKNLKAENQRLKNELDKQIKDNRKVIKALKEYADDKNWRDRGNPYMTLAVYVNCEPDEIGYEPAQRILKEVEEE